MARLIGIICPHPDHDRLAIVLPEDITTAADEQRKIIRIAGTCARTGAPVQHQFRASHG